jgi:hypothetical protein
VDSGENKNDKADVYVMGKECKNDDKLILTTQYLLDNVLGAISEARYIMKTKGKESLRSLIEELKEIYARGNYQSCFPEESHAVHTLKQVK